MNCKTDLSVRNGKKTLPARAVGSALSYVELGAGHAAAATWRVVEVWSPSDLPFAVRIQWTAGDSAGQKALVTVSRSARIGVHAQWVEVQAANLADVANVVASAIADAFLPTTNQWEETGTAESSVVQTIPIPPFADRVRLELSDPSLLPSSTLSFYDGFSGVVGVVQGDAQPDGGIPVGGARRLDLTVAGNNSNYRIIFSLRI